MSRARLLSIVTVFGILASCGGKRGTGDALDCGLGIADCAKHCRGGDCEAAKQDIEGEDVPPRSVSDGPLTADSDEEVLSEMAKSYLACQEALQDAYWNTFPASADELEWCCLIEDGMWVLKNDGCGGDPDPGCQCGVGFKVKWGDLPGCAGSVCVPMYPGQCEPKRVDPITEEYYGEDDCPANAPFFCVGNGDAFPELFCTDCPCSMLPIFEDIPCECGEWGDWCVENEECDNQACVDANFSWTGKICGGGCGEECPAGYACAQVQGGPDVHFTCVPQETNICRPCASSKECQAPGNYGIRCADLGAAGSFCVPGDKCWQGQCGEDGTCVTVVDVETGEPLTVCMPGNGLCGKCEPKYIHEAATGTCPLTNEYGTCLGTQTCTSDGLTECKGKQAKAEVCNQHDDDCDGQTDEDCP